MSSSDNGIPTRHDSDSNTSDSVEYYQAVAIIDDSDSENANSDEDHLYHPQISSSLSNGCVQGIENQVLNLEIEEDAARDAYNEETVRGIDFEESRASMEEDDRRRSEPLTPENADRVRVAMRSVSFPQWTPEWARHVPEQEWLNRLMQLRQTITEEQRP